MLEEVLEELRIFSIVLCFTDQVNSPTRWKSSAEKLETRCNLEKKLFEAIKPAIFFAYLQSYSDTHPLLNSYLKYSSHNLESIVINSFIHFHTRFLPGEPRGSCPKKTRNTSRFSAISDTVVMLAPNQHVTKQCR